MNSDTFDRLTNILTQSEERYEKLMGLLKLEKEAAIHSNAGQLAGVIEEKTELLAILAALEKRRGELLQAISAELRIPPDQVTLSRIAQCLPSEKYELFNNISKSLRSLALKVKHANEENRLLVRHCLDLVGGALAFFHQLLNPVAVYGASGRVDVRSGSGRLLSGII